MTTDKILYENSLFKVFIDEEWDRESVYQVQNKETMWYDGHFSSMAEAISQAYVWESSILAVRNYGDGTKVDIEFRDADLNLQ